MAGTENHYSLPGHCPLLTSRPSSPALTVSMAATGLPGTHTTPSAWVAALQFSGATVTCSPSSSLLICIWQASREYGDFEWAQSSSESSVSEICGSSPIISGSTYTWHVAQEQQPPHSAMISSTPPRRIASITDTPLSAWIVTCSPLRIDTISSGMLFTPSVRYFQPLHARPISRRQLIEPTHNGRPCCHTATDDT